MPTSPPRMRVDGDLEPSRADEVRSGHPGASVTGRRTVGSGSPFETQVGYSRAVRVGPFVAVAGTTAAGGDVATQARAALRRIEAALAEVGATLRDVVRTRMFVTDIARWEEVGAVHAEVFADVRPVATMIEVAALISPDLLVEIEVDAYLDESAD